MFLPNIQNIYMHTFEHINYIIIFLTIFILYWRYFRCFCSKSLFWLNQNKTWTTVSENIWFFSEKVRATRLWTEKLGLYVHALTSSLIYTETRCFLSVWWMSLNTLILWSLWFSFYCQIFSITSFCVDHKHSAA